MASPHGWDLPWAWGWCVLGIAAMAATVVLWHRDQLDLKTVLIGAVLFRLFMLPFPPLTSDDFYRYLWDGLVQHQGDNPYHHLPSSDRYANLHQLPEYTRSNSKEYHSVYPPLSQAVFYVAAAFHDWGFQASYIVLKLQWMLLEIAGIWALSRMVSARDLMLYAWNPLIIIAVVGQGHTEAGMVGLILLTLYLVSRKKPGLASLTLAAAGWIKLYPFLLFPFLVSRFGFRKLWPGALAATALGWAYLDAEAIRNLYGSLSLYLNYFEYNSGVYYALRELGWSYKHSMGIEDPRPAITYGLALAFAVTGLAAWWRHHRGRLALAPAVMLVFAAYLVCSRTVHPWYLSGVLCLLPLVPPVWRWPWLWLAAGSWGTYLLHTDGTYWPFVFIGWIGWAVGLGYALTTLPAVRRAADRSIQSMLKKRAAAKARTIAGTLEALKPTPNSEGLRLLDIGAAEGYLGEELAQRHNAHVELADIGNTFRSKLPRHIYDGRKLPIPDGHFDVAIIYFVLHHAENAEQVLREAHRVSTQRVVIVESWARGPLRKRALVIADQLANALRGGRWRDPIHYRTPGEWHLAFEETGFRLVESRDLGGWFHAKQLFVIEPIPASMVPATRQIFLVNNIPAATTHLHPPPINSITDILMTEIHGRTLAIIPALDEAETLPAVLAALRQWNLGGIRVVDNGSTDETPALARDGGAEVIIQPTRGYGAACWRGMQDIPPDICWILFCDADGCDDLTALDSFFSAAEAGHDLVLGDRNSLPASRATLTWPQRFGNSLAGFLIALRWGSRFRDLGPLRLVRRSSLETFHMRDRGFGWTVEMQAKAAMLGYSCIEIPVRYHRRKGGKSKIAGTLSGTVKAGTIILLTLAKLWVSKPSTASPSSSLTARCAAPP